jgi:V8-like Glu-specific endopeptidase
VEDFGLVRLAADLNPANGLFPAMYSATDNELHNRECDIAGYPADKEPLYTMWNGSGKVSTDPQSEDFLLYEISTYGGNSGSAVRSLFPNKDSPSIVGIHVGGVEMEIQATNLAVRLNDSVIEMINDWKKVQ